MAAALLVVGFHLGFWIFRDPNVRLPTPGALRLVEPVISKGWVGVEIFFVISGFVIAYSTEGATPARFVRHRVTRLLPAALICATLTGLSLLRAFPLSAVSWEWLRSVTFWPVGPWIDGSYWTLPIEIAFYLLILGVLFIQRGRYLVSVMATVGVVSAATRLLVLARPAWFPRLWMLFLDRAGFPPQACLLLNFGAFFALGVFLFFWLLHGATAVRVGMVVLCLVGCFAEISSHELGLSGVVGQPPSIAMPMLLWTVAVLLLVLSTVWNAELQSRFGERGRQWSRRLGLVTYPLYLLHVSLGEQLIAGLHRRLGYGVAILVAVTFVFGLACFVSEVLEPPLRNAVAARLAQPVTARPATRVRNEADATQLHQ